MDFRGATNFSPTRNLDGDPVVIFKAKENGPIIEPEKGEGEIEITAEGEAIIEYGLPESGAGITTMSRKYYPRGVEVKVINERVIYG